jgi:hypothetical protein
MPPEVDTTQPDTSTTSTPTPVPPANPSAANPSPAQPAPPPKETVGGGFTRGMVGEQYAVDGQGNLVNLRRTSPSGKGTFGSILAGAVMGALAGASAARPGGIPSHELGGGSAAGAVAADKTIQGRDVQRRERAQQDFQNRNVEQKAADEHLSYRADLHMKDLQAIQLAQTINNAKENDPLHHEQLQNAVELSNMQLDSEAKNLGLINERTFSSYQEVPKADIDKFHRQQVKLIAQPDGSVKVWDRTFDPRTTPNAEDFEVKDLVGLDPKTGKPEWKTIGTVKAGAGTAAQLEQEVDKEHTQLMAAAKSNADIAKSQAEAEKATSGAQLDQAMIANMKNLGVVVPPNFKTPDNVFSMDANTLRQQIVGQGATVPANFQTLYGIGHYDVPISDMIKQSRVRGGSGMTQDNAVTYIKTFINPGFNQKTYDTLKDMEKEFASTKGGTAGGNLLAFNTATDHLGQLYDAAQALKNGNLKFANGILRQLDIQEGKSAPQVYNNIANALTGESGKVYEGGYAPDVKTKDDIRKTLGLDNSPAGFDGVIKSTAHLMLSKAGEEVNRYVSYKGVLPPQAISPTAAQVYKKLGIDTGEILPNAPATPAGATGAGGPGTLPGAPPTAGAAPPIPPAVAKALANQGPGKHTLTDKSVWIKAADGTITPASPQGQ